MSLALGSDGIQQLYVGADGVLSVCLGDVLIWSQGGPAPLPDFALKFSSPSSGASFWVQPVSSPSTSPAFEYTTDGASWTTYTLGQTVSIPQNGTVYFKATGFNQSMSQSGSSYWQLQTAGDVKVEGQLYSLVDPSGDERQFNSYYFTKFLQYSGNAQHLSAEISLSGLKTVPAHGMESIAENLNASRLSVDFSDIVSVDTYGMNNAFSYSSVSGDIVLTSLVATTTSALSRTFFYAPNIDTVYIGNQNSEISIYNPEDQGSFETFSRSGVKRAVLDCRGFWKSHQKDDGLYSMFTNCNNLTSAEINCRELSGGGFYLRTWFKDSPHLSVVSFPNLSVLDSKRCFYETFEGCSSLVHVEFPELISAYCSQGTEEGNFSKCFYGCSSLTGVSFPKLTAMQNTVFKPTWPSFDPWHYGIFDKCPEIKTVLFSARGAKSISATNGYSSKWGAPNDGANVSVHWWVGQNEVVPSQYFIGSLSGYRPSGTELLSGTENIHRLSSQAMQRFAVKSTVSALNGHLDLSNLQYVGDAALMSAFTSCEGISSITIGSPDVPDDTNGRQIFGQNYQVFSFMPDLEEVSVGFKSLDNNWTQSNSTAWQRQGKWFADCPKLRKAVFTELDHLSARHQTNRNYTIDPLFGWFARSSVSCVEFPKLSWIKAQSGTLSYIFTGCSSLLSVEFPALSSVEAGWTTDQPLDCLAHGAPNLSLLSFPCLSVLTNPALNDMLVDAPGVTTLRFPAGISATLTAQEQWPTKFGSPNSSTISVWCGNDLIYPEISEPEPDYTTDTDGDGLPDYDEVNSYNTDPNSTDTDEDGYDDLTEVEKGTDPNDSSSYPQDTDGDGLTDDEETTYGTDPENYDSDYDGYSDGEEVAAGTNPNDPDNNPGNQNPGGEGGM